jgi:hypothetical protein
LKAQNNILAASEAGVFLPAAGGATHMPALFTFGFRLWRM